MEYRRLGDTGLRVSEISLGSWLTIGSSVGTDDTKSLVHKAFEGGINLFDTADVYAGGAAEESLGKAIRDLPRTRLVLATKCFFPMSRDTNDRGLSRKHVVESVERSLARLGTDYLDLHQCHRPDPETPMEETVRAYEDLIRQGKLLYWGVSEWSAAQIVDACHIADAHSAYRPISNQPRYNIMRRHLEADVLPTSVRFGLGQIVFSPLGQGVLTGKYSGGQRPTGSRAADTQRNQFMDAYLEEGELAKVDQLTPLADGLGLSLAQLALAWCLRQPGVSSAIIGVTRPEQLDDNLKASGVTLPDDVLARIDAIFPA
ncbi:MAG: aldo/keto reductase family protein [Myxococcota bacterium]|nr:aldo/keto reductase family protein [Myxococcota bacterium]